MSYVNPFIKPKKEPKKSAFAKSLENRIAKAKRDATNKVATAKYFKNSAVAQAVRNAQERRSRATAHIGPSKGSLTFDPFQAKRDAMARQASMAQVQQTPVSVSQSIPSITTAPSFAPSVPSMPSMDYEAPPVEAQESEEQPTGNKVLLLGGLALLALFMFKKK